MAELVNLNKEYNDSVISEAQSVFNQLWNVIHETNERMMKEDRSGKNIEDVLVNALIHLNCVFVTTSPNYDKETGLNFLLTAIKNHAQLLYGITPKVTDMNTIAYTQRDNLN